MKVNISDVRQLIKSVPRNKEKAKKCKCCGKFKLFSEFYNDVSQKDGKRSYCKPCYNTYEKQPHRKIRRLISGSISRSISKFGIEKLPQRTQDYIGCSAKELTHHLERNFTSDMSWNNHGTVWHIDHIIPVKSFEEMLGESPTSDEIDVVMKKAHHYTNLRPYRALDNLKKGSKLEPNRYELIEKNVKQGAPIKKMYPRGSTRKIVRGIVIDPTILFEV